MENAVENLPPSASGVMFKNGMRGTAGNNPSFFRTTGEGEIKCWMAVDSETGTIDIRDENEKTLIEINAKTKKVFLAGLDLGRGIADALESATNANEDISQAKEDIEDVREKTKTAQITADQAIEEVGILASGLSLLISDEINKALVRQVNPVIESVRKLITNLKYNRETEPEETRVQLPDLIDTTTEIIN